MNNKNGLSENVDEVIIPIVFSGSPFLYTLVCIYIYVYVSNQSHKNHIFSFVEDMLITPA